MERSGIRESRHAPRAPWIALHFIQATRRVPLLACPAVAAYTMTMTPGPPHRKRVTHFNEPGH
jgi:hypothetical protein